MNEKRYNSIIGNLNSSEQKVLEAVPKREEWGMEKIHTELYRQGIQMQRDKVSGCLHTLVEVGLVKVRNRLYTNACRVEPTEPINPLPLEKVVPMLTAKVSPAQQESQHKTDPHPVLTAPALAPVTTLSLPQTNMTQATNTVVSNKPTAEKFDFMGSLAAKAERLRTMAAEMTKEADDLEALAMQIAEYEQMVEGKLASFKQLQQLLKNIQE